MDQSGWIRAVDEELVTTHLGVANHDDSYEDAKRKLQALIAWHVDVVTDTKVNGGYTLVRVIDYQGTRMTTETSYNYQTLTQRVLDNHQNKP